MIQEVIGMKQMLSKCPECNGLLKVSLLHCPDCGMELKKEYPLSIFDQLEEEQYAFLISFLKNRGNMKEVQSELQMSYPAAKKKLEELLFSLGLSEVAEGEERGKIDMSNLHIDYTSKKASEIIKAKLKENGGKVTVYTARGLPCEIYAEPDGVSFSSDKLPLPSSLPNYEYKVFDEIVKCLREQGGCAKKGNGRNFKLGERGCEKNTVVGAIAVSRGYEEGQSIYDPVFVMAAILEWAGIAKNGRGYLELTKEFIKD